MRTCGPGNGKILENGHDAEGDATGHRTGERPAGAVRGAFEKIMSGIRSYLKHGGQDAGPDNGCGGSAQEETPEALEETEEEKAQGMAEYYTLTREERCHLKARREMEQLAGKSPVFAQCLLSCVQTPIREGIAIGCPNVPIYRLVRSCTEDAQYLFTVYEPE